MKTGQPNATKSISIKSIGQIEILFAAVACLFAFLLPASVSSLLIIRTREEMRKRRKE
jgi:hypothetical protein